MAIRQLAISHHVPNNGIYDPSKSYILDCKECREENPRMKAHGAVINEFWANRAIADHRRERPNHFMTYTIEEAP